VSGASAATYTVHRRQQDLFIGQAGGFDGFKGIVGVEIGPIIGFGRGGNHDATPRMANENDGAVAGAIQGALYRRHIILQRGQRVLNRNGVEPLSVETTNDLTPAGTIGP